MPGENIYDWSTTAASNGNADSSINWAEGQARASVNNSARSMMAAHAKQRNLHNGSIVTAGTINAQTFSSGLNFTGTVPTGFFAKIKIGVALTNSGPATLNMDSIGPVIVVNQFGEALGPGEITAGAIVDVVYDGTNWRLLTVLPGTGFSTGDIKTTFKATADIGWIIMDDGSIGNEFSGATTRANADTADLFALLYDNITALVLQDSIGITTTRGASADVDYANSTRLVIPKMLGRSLAVAGSGASLTARVLGSTAGAETIIQSVDQMPSHTHDLTMGLRTGTVSINGGYPEHCDNVPLGPSAAPVNANGGGLPMDIVDPTTYINVMIKL